MRVFVFVVVGVSHLSPFVVSISSINFSGSSCPSNTIMLVGVRQGQHRGTRGYAWHLSHDIAVLRPLRNQYTCGNGCATEVQIPESHLKPIPDHWRMATCGSRFDQLGIMINFESPSLTAPVPSIDRFSDLCNPPTPMEIKGFWGDKCYPYILQRLRARLHGRKLQDMHAFVMNPDWKAGVVWCDGTKPDQQSELGPADSFGKMWWPVVYTEAGSHAVAYCQAQALQKSRGWVTNMQRLRQVQWDSLQVECLTPAIQLLSAMPSSAAELPAVPLQKSFGVPYREQVSSTSREQSGTRIFSGTAHKLGGKEHCPAPFTQSSPTPLISQSCSTSRNHDCVSSDGSHEDHQLASECNVPLRGRWNRRFGPRKTERHVNASEVKSQTGELVAV